jgi:hypothetical protein
MNEVLLYPPLKGYQIIRSGTLPEPDGVRGSPSASLPVQGFLAHKKTPMPLGPPYDPKHGPTAGSSGGAFSCKGGTPVRISPENQGHALAGDKRTTRQGRRRRSGKAKLC